MKQSTIVIDVDGAKMTFFVTRKTRCSDVINTAASQLNACVALWEIASGKERRLSGTSKILKVIQAWGADASNCKLIGKKTETEVSSRKASIAKTFLQSIRRKLGVESTDTGIVSVQTMSEKENNLDRSSDTSLSSNISTSKTENSGKCDIMRRFIQDTQEFYRRLRLEDVDNVEMLTNVAYRTPGDGMETCLPSDDESIADFTRELLDHAFLANAKNVDKVNLNECFLDYGDMTSDSESAFGDDSECSSMCELERNVYDFDEVNETTLRRLRVMFSDGDLTKGADDTALESFMKTVVVLSDDYDEGLSSIGSDVSV